MVFFDHLWPQRMTATRTRYISYMVEEGVREDNSGGHVAENHLPP